MRHHELKTWPEQFEAIKDGRKTFEFRKNDRGFSVGDIIALQEYNPKSVMIADPRSIDGLSCKVIGYTGREIIVQIIYILESGFGLPDGYVIFSFINL